MSTSSEIRKPGNGVPQSRVGHVSPYEQLSGLFEEFRGESHLVILQGVPDPDAISSALALSVLGGLYDIETTILCFSPTSHHENRALVKRLEIPLATYSEDFDFSCYSIYSIVDSQKFHTKVDRKIEAADLTFFAFIDHHREDPNTPPARFVDIRPHVASTAAICCEYLQHAFPKGLEPGDPTHLRLATALMHGIRSDTVKFLLATRLEYQGAAFLAPCVDAALIESIEQRVLSSTVLGVLQNALVKRRVHDNFIFSDVGFVRVADRDGIPQAADLLLAREGTDTVLVVGVVDGNFIDGSLRTRSSTINPDEFLKGLFGTSPESGEYYGGGNLRDRGGFQIPLGFIGLHEDKNQVYSMTIEVIEKAFLAHIGKKLSDDAERPPMPPQEGS